MADAIESVPLPAVRRVPASAPLRWLAAGFRDFVAAPLPAMFYGLVLAAMGAAVAYVFRHAYEYVWGLTTGFLLVGPFLAIGLYDLARRIERGEPAMLAPTLDAWRPNVSSIGLFALVLGVLLLVWSRASLIVIAVFFPDEMPSVAAFARNIGTASHLEFVLVYFAVGGFFALLTFAIAVVSVPLMMDRGTDGVSAVLTSLTACRENVPAMIVWGLAIFVLVAIGFAGWYVGLVVTMPWIGLATWHAYREVVAR